MATKEVHPVDEILPPQQLAIFGLQHVLVMYAGAVAVPLVLGTAFGMTPVQVVSLISANLLTSGIATLIQSVGIWKFGARLPLIQGCSFVAIAPMIGIAQSHGVSVVFGSVIACGLATILIAPYFSKLLKLFPAVVVGSIITVIGISLLPVACGWLAGGNPTAANFGAPSNIGLGFLTIAVSLTISAVFRGFIGNLSILLGLIVGTLVAIFTGMADFSTVNSAQWFEILPPFAFGPPKFELVPIMVMMTTMCVIMAETTGNCLAIGKLVGRPTDQQTLANAFRADGLSTMIGGIFNSFPYNAFSQNTGLIAISNIKSRYVVAMAGVFLIAMGLFPKIGAIIASIPKPVLGGSAVIMFGMTSVAGIQILSKVKFEGTRNALVIATSVGIGLVPTSFKPVPELQNIFHHFPEMAQLFLDSGIFLTAFFAVVLNLILNRGIQQEEEHDEILQSRPVQRVHLAQEH